MSKTIDIFVIQNTDKCVESDDKDNCEGYLQSLFAYYYFNGAIIVSDIPDFIDVVTKKVMMSGGAKIKNLVIGSHGHGDGYPGAYFRIGSAVIDHASTDHLTSLGLLAPFFAKDADVFILACHTGQSKVLLQKVSKALGGIRVHGYTESIETNGFTLDDGTRDGGQQIVCVLGKCKRTDQQRPARASWLNSAR